LSQPEDRRSSKIDIHRGAKAVPRRTANHRDRRTDLGGWK